MTAAKPRWIASSVARTAPTTEAKPLMAHAQGMVLPDVAASRAIPVGKGIPMHTASGAINATEIAILAASDKWMSA